MRLVGASVLVLSVLGVWPQAQVKDRLPEGVVSVTGAELPEWIVWTSGFTALHLIHKLHAENGGGPPAILALSESDRRLAFEEGDLQVKRDEQCSERQRPAVQAWESASEKEKRRLERALHEITVECRWRALEARDRLLQRLSPEGGAALSLWIQGRRTSITSTVAKAELADFRQPQ